MLWHGHVDVATVGARHFRYGVIFDLVSRHLTARPHDWPADLASGAAGL